MYLYHEAWEMMQWEGQTALLWYCSPKCKTSFNHGKILNKCKLGDIPENNRSVIFKCQNHEQPGKTEELWWRGN